MLEGCALPLTEFGLKAETLCLARCGIAFDKWILTCFSNRESNFKRLVMGVLIYFPFPSIVDEMCKGLSLPTRPLPVKPDVVQMLLSMRKYTIVHE